eukprot:1696123-Alexandrium_andersonii.AAC.1
MSARTASPTPAGQRVLRTSKRPTTLPQPGAFGTDQRTFRIGRRPAPGQAGEATGVGGGGGVLETRVE